MALTDKTIMTFGTHKGKEIQDIPATWFMWFKGKLEDKKNLGTKLTDIEKDFDYYIDDNIDVLKKEIREANQQKKPKPY